MVFGVSVSSDIPHPDVESSVSQQVGKALTGQVGQPVGTGAEETMLEEEHWTLCRRKKIDLVNIQAETSH